MTTKTGNMSGDKIEIKIGKMIEVEVATKTGSVIEIEELRIVN